MKPEGLPKSLIEDGQLITEKVLIMCDPWEFFFMKVYRLSATFN